MTTGSSAGDNASRKEISMEYDRNVFIKECRVRRDGKGLGMSLMGWIVICHLCKVAEFFGDMSDTTGCLLGHQSSAQHKEMVRWMDEVVANQA